MPLSKLPGMIRKPMVFWCFRENCKWPVGWSGLKSPCWSTLITYFTIPYWGPKGTSLTIFFKETISLGVNDITAVQPNCPMIQCCFR